MDSYSKLLELVNTSGCFAPANHMYVTELRPDHSAVGVLDVQPSSLNPMGIVHGGALVGVEQIGLQEDLAVSDGDHVGRNVCGYIACLGLDDGKCRQGTSAVFVTHADRTL